MKIANGSVVAVEYKLHLGDGELIDESEAGSPLFYIQGDGNIVPGLERALEHADGLGLVGLLREGLAEVVVHVGLGDPRGAVEALEEQRAEGLLRALEVART